MASSINSGNFSNQPIQNRKTGEKAPAAPKEQSLELPQDGLTLSTPAPQQAAPQVAAEAPKAQAAPEQATAQKRPELDNSPVYDPATGTLSFHDYGGTNFDLATREKGSAWFSHGTHEGAHLTGPGVTASLTSIGSLNASSGASESTFTNGLGSTQLMSLSGKVLADLSPFKS
jgi:hypothetical protein